MVEIDQNLINSRVMVKKRLEKEGRDYVWEQCTRTVNANLRMRRKSCSFFVPDQIIGNFAYNLEDGNKYISKKLSNTPNVQYKFYSPNLFVINIG